jgi:hypothetical protein
MDKHRVDCGAAMRDNIVVLKGYTALEDRSWMCHTEGEGTRLARWLSDNGKPAMATSVDDWNRMKNNTFPLPSYPKEWGWK